ATIYNGQAALKEANEIRAIENEWLESQNKEKKAGEVDRVAGSLRMMLLGDYVDAYSEKVEDTMADVPDEMLRKVFDLVTNKNSKISAKMVDEKVKRYKESMEKKPRKVTKSEINEDGIDIPPEVKGGLKRKFLVKRYEPQIDAEIIFREIKVPLINQVTEDEEEINYQRATKKNLMKVGIRDKKRVLLEHELALRSIHNRPGQGFPPASHCVPDDNLSRKTVTWPDHHHTTPKNAVFDQNKYLAGHNSGLLVDDGVEGVVTVGSGPGAQRSAAGAASAPKFGRDPANADPCRRRRRDQAATWCPDERDRESAADEGPEEEASGGHIAGWIHCGLRHRRGRA
ncbi:hypothetical protein THAOC_37425, partial [Thalassiosira oceanica]